MRSKTRPPERAARVLADGGQRQSIGKREALWRVYGALTLLDQAYQRIGARLRAGSRHDAGTYRLPRIRNTDHARRVAREDPVDVLAQSQRWRGAEDEMRRRTGDDRVVLYPRADDHSAGWRIAGAHPPA